MKKLLTIGKASTDMTSSNTGRAMSVESLQPKAGGALSSVCGACTALGGESAMTTILGKDASDEKIMKEMQQFHTYAEHIKQTNAANTSLAFVVLDEHANRESSFYRNMGVDMLLSEKDIKESWFGDYYGLHFCSVSLGDLPMKEAHNQALELVRRKNLPVSFDLNVRLSLLDDYEYPRRTTHKYMHFADILEVSDEEISLIFGSDRIEEHVQYISNSGVKLLTYTTGKDGVITCTKYNTTYADGIGVEAVDTTGAGNGSIRCLLYHLSEDDTYASDLDGLSKHRLRSYLDMCNKSCSISVTKEGATTSYPSR